MSQKQKVKVMKLEESRFKKKDDEFEKAKLFKFDNKQVKPFISPNTQQFFNIDKKKTFNESLVKKRQTDMNLYPNLSILKQQYDDKNKSYQYFMKMKQLELVNNLQQPKLQNTLQFFNLTETFQTKQLQKSLPYLVLDKPDVKPQTQTHTTGYHKSRKTQVFKLPNFYADITQKQFNSQIKQKNNKKQNSINLKINNQYDDVLDTEIFTKTQIDNQFTQSLIKQKIQYDSSINMKNQQEGILLEEESKKINVQQQNQTLLELIQETFEVKQQDDKYNIQKSQFVDENVMDFISDIKNNQQAFNFFAKYGNSTPIKYFFCTYQYTNVFMPYELQVINYKQAMNLDYFFVISSFGIVQLKNQIKYTNNDILSNMIQSNDWMQQQSQFNVLTQLSFFQFFFGGKIFIKWKQKSYLNLFKKRKMSLCNKGVLLRKGFGFYVQKIIIYVQNMKDNILICNKNKRLQRLWDFDTFIQKLTNERRERLQFYNDQINELIDEFKLFFMKLNDNRQFDLILQRINQAYQKMKIQKNDLKTDIKSKSINQVRLEKQMYYELLSQNKQDKFIFYKLIRMSQYMINNALIYINYGSIQTLLDIFQVVRKVGIFKLILMQEDNHFYYKPNKEYFINKIQSQIEDILHVIQNTHKIQSYFEFKQIQIDLVQNIKLSQLQQQIVQSINHSINKYFDQSLDHIIQLNKCLYIQKEYQHLQIKENHHQFINQDYKIDESQQAIQICLKQQQDIENYIKDSLKGVFLIQTSIQKQKLLTFISFKLNYYKKYMYSNMKNLAQQTMQDLEKYELILKQLPIDLKQFKNYIHHLKHIKHEMIYIQESKQQIEAIHSIFRRFDQNVINHIDQSQLTFIQQLIYDINQLTEIGENYILEKKNENIEKYDKTYENISKLIDTQIINVSSGLTVPNQIIENKFDLFLKINEIKQELNEKSDKLNQIKDDLQILKEYKMAINEEFIEIENLEILDGKSNDRKLLWETIEQFLKDTKEWTFSSIKDIDINLMEKKMENYELVNNQLKFRIKNLSNSGNDFQLNFYQQELYAFKEIYNLIPSLGNKDLRSHHYKQIFNILGVEEIINGFSFNDLLKLGAQQHKNKIEQISLHASGESLIQNQLDQIIEKWKKLNFQTQQISDQDKMHKLIQAEDIFMILDDNLISIQSMLGTKYVNDIKDKVLEWNQKLNTININIEEWLQLQKNWIYLENIFNGQDIQKKLFKESQSFQITDKFFKTLMTKTIKSPNILDLCGNIEINAVLKKHNSQLDIILKSLQNYLESIRLTFPRFFIISNDDLLLILGETRKPSGIQPHLRKVFDNLNKLVFDDDFQQNQIIAFKSFNPVQMPETVTFKEPIDIQTGENLETWLKNLEIKTQQELKYLSKECFNIYDKNNRKQWLFQDYPAQCILLIELIKWQENVTTAIYENKGLENCYRQQESIINDLVEIVKQDLNILQSTLICTLLVIDVHLRDVIEFLNQTQTKDLQNFNWLKQLRYYWINDDCQIFQNHCKFQYNYEYLGNGQRLVMTPLTDQCYITLTTALSLYQGGMPNGPAGTGKTETVKDLSKALAIFCIVFNCSEILDNKTITEQLKAICQCGCWICYDEYNRLKIDVISIMTQQIIQIQTALKRQDQKIEMDQIEFPLDNKLGIFITLNPTYQNRTILPESLKCLFRPIAMMVPDYELIAEILLLSNGFINARVLSRKICQILNYSSQQLSQQKHYDFGMRALKQILVVASLLRKEHPQSKEDQIILQSIYESNIAKFLKQDCPLFISLLDDFFPEQVIPESPNLQLQSAIENNLIDQKYKSTNSYVNKILQLFETFKYRNGVMIIGQTGSGKTTLYQTLQMSLKDLNEENEEFKIIQSRVINPKSLTINQIYGYNNLVINEWVDGVLPNFVRESQQDKSDDLYWFIFDGPVDSEWIENLNTSLDDNKLVCLANGERIKLPIKFGFLFELDNLNQASPATVSRCGMIYLDENSLGFQAIIQAQIEKFIIFEFKSENIRDVQDPIAKQILNYEKKLIDFFSSNYNSHLRDFDEIIKGSVITIVKSCLNIVISLFQELKIIFNKFEYIYTLSQANQDNLFNIIIIFAIIWSYGINIVERENRKNRAKISQFIKSKILKIYINFPLEGEVFDYMIDYKTFKFVEWGNDIQKFKYDNTIPFYDIFIPNSGTIKYNYLIEQLKRNSFNVLLLGELSTCKTQIIKNFIQNLDDNHRTNQINITNQVTVQNIHDLYQNRFKNNLMRKSSINEYIHKKTIMFIDDINLAHHDQFGASPVIEILREIIDHQGQYDQKTMKFVRISQTQLLAAGNVFENTEISVRFTRHFNMIWASDLNHQNLKFIYENILLGYFESSPNRKDFITTVKNIVDQTIEIYKLIQQSFLPTPYKPHLLFNMRDIAKVFQGIIQVIFKQVKVKAFHMQNKQMLVKIWVHELQRQFYDRLNIQEDKDLFDKWLDDILKQSFKMQFQDLNQQIICDFMNKKKDYVQCEVSIDQAIQDAVTQYNMYNTKQLNILIFNDFTRHLLNLSRMMRMDRQNALLIGLLGSGRNTICKIVAFMKELKVFEIDTTKVYKEQNWQDDLKDVIKQSATKDIKTLFILNDQQIQDLSFIDNINSLVNNQEVPNLLQMDDLDEIFNNLKQIIKDKAILESKQKMIEIYKKKLEENLKIAIILSPLGNKLRQIIRNTPQLLNFFNIDWYQFWPQNALISITIKELNQYDLNIKNCQQNLATCFVKIHQSVIKKKDQYLKEQDRLIYITPSIFLDFIKTYIQILLNKSYQIPIAVEKYEKGMKIINQTNKDIAILKQKVLEYQPTQQQQFLQNQELKQELHEQSSLANETKDILAVSTKEINDQQNKIEEEKQMIEKENNEAQIILSECKESVNKIDKPQLIILKSYIHPPEQVRLVLQATCLLFGYEENWESAKRYLLSDIKFLDKLINFDVLHKDARFQKYRQKYSKNKDFDRITIEKISTACTQIFDWLQAIDKYQSVFVVSYTKEQKLIQTLAELNKIKSNFYEQNKQLNLVSEKAFNLDRKYKESLQFAKQITQQIEDAKLQLTRAEKLLSGLELEQIRWKKSKLALQDSEQSLIGDMMLCSAFIEYLGPFSQNYRQSLIEKWIELAKDSNLQITSNFQLENIICNDNQIQEWLSNELPFDKQQIENAIIIFNSRKWPLIIDPTNQANNWIKNIYKNQNLQVTSQKNGKYQKILSSAIQFGQIFLLENVEEQIDSALEPILLKQTTKKGLQYLIKLGETEINLSVDFKMFMTSKLENPHFLPEISNKISLINFNISRVGLEEQLLNEILKIDRPDLESKLKELVQEILQQNEILTALEDKVLQKIGESKDQLLNNDELINIIQDSGKTYLNVKNQMQNTISTKDEINKTTEKYRLLAARGAIIYFCLQDLIKINHMYQWSLDIFLIQYRQTINQSQQFKFIEDRVDNLVKDITINYSQKMRIGLFSQDQLLLSFYICSRILFESGQIDHKSWNFFVLGTSLEQIQIQQQFKPSWLSDQTWTQIQYFTDLNQKDLSSIYQTFTQQANVWQRIIQSNNPFYESFPESLNLTQFQKLILLKILCPDKFQQSSQQFMDINNMEYLNQKKPNELQDCYEDTNCQTPLIFILQHGIDLDQTIDILAKQNNKELDHDVIIVQFTNDQIKNIEYLNQQARKNGFWLVLKDCQITESQFSILDKIAFDNNIKTHQNFRLFLVTECNKKFPNIIIQNSLKYSIESPQNLKHNIQTLFYKYHNEKSDEYNKILFKIIVFHSLIIQRQKFGFLGWNNCYDWMNTDLQSSLNLIENITNQNQTICYQFLKFIISEIIYGGKVTDFIDKRVLKTALDEIFYPQSYYLNSYNMERVNRYLDELPIHENLNIYGLHRNASIISEQDKINKFFDNIKIIQVGQQKDQQNNENLIKSISNHLHDYMQEIKYKNKQFIKPLVNFRNQEIHKYNILIYQLQHSLHELHLQQSGEIILSQTLENTIESFNQNQIPINWKSYSFETQMTLAQWIQEFKKRYNFITSWAQNEELEKYQFSSFFFPSGFLTCVKQNYSRQQKIQIDQIYIRQDLQQEKQQDSIIIYGLFIQGAMIDQKSQTLQDLTKKIIFHEIQDIQLIPENISQKQTNLKIYECPVYQTSIRRGELSTNGQSSNFIDFFNLKTDQDPSIWIKRGVAIILQNDE